MRKVMFLVVLLAVFAMIGCTSYAPLYISGAAFSKVGEADDSQGGVITAARNGGISRVALVDVKKTFYLIFTTRHYIVAGE